MYFFFDEFVDKHNLEYTDKDNIYKFINNNYDEIYISKESIDDSEYESCDIDDLNKNTLEK